MISFTNDPSYKAGLPLYFSYINEAINYCTRNQHIAGLVHELSEGNCIKVLKSRLMTSVSLAKAGINAVGQTGGGDWEAGGQYPGVYTFAVLTNQLGEDLLTRGTHFTNFGDGSEIALVFSTALLERRAWHINTTDINGYITEKTYFPEEIKDFPFNNYADSPHGNEVIFHDDIEIEFLQEIWIKKYINDPKKNDKYAEQFKNLLKSNGLEKYVPLVKTDAGDTGKIPNRRFDKFCDDKAKLDEIRNSKAPNYCSVYYNTKDTRIVPNKKTLKLIAMECGLDPKEANEMSFEELHDYVMDHQVEKARDR